MWCLSPHSNTVCSVTNEDGWFYFSCKTIKVKVECKWNLSCQIAPLVKWCNLCFREMPSANNSKTRPFWTILVAVPSSLLNTDGSSILQYNCTCASVRAGLCAKSAAETRRNHTNSVPGDAQSYWQAEPLNNSPHWFATIVSHPSLTRLYWEEVDTLFNMHHSDSY